MDWLRVGLCSLFEDRTLQSSCGKILSTLSTLSGRARLNLLNDNNHSRQLVIIDS